MKPTGITSGEHKIFNNMSRIENNRKEQMLNLLGESPIDKNELVDSLALFEDRQSLQRILFLNEIYQKILHTHGVIIEFGVRWGVNMANLIKMRSIYEPYNHTRKIIGFDTFEGFPEVSKEDGSDPTITKGSHTVAKGYSQYLEKILKLHEEDAPINHIKKFELVEGDATSTYPQYINENQETLISLAYFDFDIYAPTKSLLEQIKPRLVKGAVIAFDELNYHRFPGETLAFMEVLGASNYNLVRSPNSSAVSYLIYE